MKLQTFKGKLGRFEHDSLIAGYWTKMPVTCDDCGLELEVVLNEKKYHTNRSDKVYVKYAKKGGVEGKPFFTGVLDKADVAVNRPVRVEFHSQRNHYVLTATSLEPGALVEVTAVEA